MKDPLNRTKVVLRHLPLSIPESALMEQIDGRFAGRYKWFSFRPGKHSHKNQRYSRAYIDFQSLEDVVEFAEFFDGHIFVNEKGSQFKSLVEYAPSQCVPKVLSKKDGREGTIYKDPEYLKFLEFIAKPVENLPSAEIQLERREAERAGGPKESVIVTPLMDFIRQKRAAKSGSQVPYSKFIVCDDHCMALYYQRSSANRKLRRRAGGSANSSRSSSKRGPEKRRDPTSVYVLKDSSKTRSNGKDKSTYMLVSRKEEQQASSATEESEEGTVKGLNGTITIASGTVEIGKRRVMLLKGKEREASHVSGGSSQQPNATASVRNLTGSTSSKQSPRHEATGRTIRSILSNKDMLQGQSYLGGIQSEQQTQEVNYEREKRLPRPPNSCLIMKDTSIATPSSVPYGDKKKSLNDKAAVNNLFGSVSTGDNKNEKRMRNKDRPDRGVWTPRRSDGVHATDDNHLSAQQLSDSLDGISMSQLTVGPKDGDADMGFVSADGGCGSNSRAAYYASLSHGDIKPDLFNSNRIAESRGGRANISPAENAAHRYVGRRGSAHSMKEVDGFLNFSEGKTSKRGVSAGYGSHERQVWVQKSGSGS